RGLQDNGRFDRLGRRACDPAASPGPAAAIQPGAFPMKDTFSARDTLEVNGKRYAYASLAKLGQQFDLKRLPYSMKILLENLLRREDGEEVTAAEIKAIATWDPRKEP